MRRLTFFVVVALLGAACGDSAAAADPERFCEINEKLDQLGSFFGAPPDEAREIAGETRDLLDESARVAPDEIRPSVERLAALFMQLLDSFEAAQFDATQWDSTEFEAAFADDEVAASDDAVDEWLGTNCST